MSGRPYSVSSGPGGVGAAVGAAVGAVVGAFVGLPVGSGEPWEAAVGDAEGVAVGTDVGDTLMTCAVTIGFLTVSAAAVGTVAVDPNLIAAFATLATRVFDDIASAATDAFIAIASLPRTVATKATARERRREAVEVTEQPSLYAMVRGFTIFTVRP